MAHCGMDHAHQTAEFFVRLPSGQRFGPAAMGVLEQWAREGRIPSTAQIEPADASAPARPPRSVLSEPGLMAILGAPPTVAGTLSMPESPDSGISTLIPYKNGYALAAYYVSVASLIPGLGLLAGPIAFGLGIAGVRHYKREPKVKGIAHAWVGIILGFLTFAAHVALIVAVIVSAMGK